MSKLSILYKCRSPVSAPKSESNHFFNFVNNQNSINMNQSLTHDARSPHSALGFVQRLRTRRTGNRWLSTAVLALFAVLLTVNGLNAQIAFNQNFDLNSTGWTGGGTAPTGAFTRFTGVTACGGVGGSMRRNVYTAGTNGSMVSPAIPGNNAALVTLNYTYKVRNWSANTVGSAAWGSYTVQYSTVGTAGPWINIATITNEAQASVAACLSKSHSFTPAASTNIWIRWTTAWGSGDYYLNFDDVVITQAAGSPCVGTPAPGSTLTSLASEFK